ncbi:MAG: PepSY-like domain-containing protein [Tannerella sp.]|nr:PepSY-like domain-containing protein [Tannerella sp.]
MKTLSFRRFIIGIIALSGMFPVACEQIFEPESNSSSGHMVPKEVLQSFDSKYPNAAQIVWGMNFIFYIADFVVCSTRMQVWFDGQGNWLQSRKSLRMEQLAEPVIIAFFESEYGDWEVKDACLLERKGMAIIYLIGLSGDKGFLLYYSGYGHLIQMSAENENASFPRFVAPELRGAVNRLFGQAAAILEIWTELPGVQVGILDGREFIIAAFDEDYNWISSISEIGKAILPVPVLNAFEMSEYGNRRIKTCRVQVNREGQTYMIYFEDGAKNKVMRLTETGKILYVLAYD